MAERFRRIREIDGYQVSVSCRRQSATRKRFLADYYRPDGQRVRYPLGTPDPDTAVRLLDQYLDSAGFRDDIRQGIAIKQERESKAVSLAQLRDYYCDVYLVNRNRAAKSRTGARKILEDFAAYAATKGVKNVTDLRRPVVDGYISSLYTRPNGCSAKTVHNHLSTLRAAINAAVDGELLSSSPITRWPTPKLHDAEIYPLTREELNEVLRLVHEHAPRAYPIVAWIALTGQRPSDARDLRFKQVDIRRRVCHRMQAKVKRLAKFDLAPEAAKIVAREKLKRRGARPNDHVFVNTGEQAANEPWKESALYRAFRFAIDSGTLRRDVNLKDLRHTYAHFMANEIRCPLPKLQVQMGHADIRMTLKYVYPGDAKEETAEYADKLTLPEAL